VRAFSFFAAIMAAVALIATCEDGFPIAGSMLSKVSTAEGVSVHGCDIYCRSKRRRLHRDVCLPASAGCGKSFAHANSNSCAYSNADADTKPVPGTRLNRAQSVWNNAGFTTSVTTSGCRRQLITWQSLPQRFIGSCSNTTIVVQCIPQGTPTRTPTP
jgi:hypothetical protein